MTIRELITSVVEDAQGLKLTELAASLVTRMANEQMTINTDDVIVMIEEMIEKKELVAVEYILPQMIYRVKTFILPKHTQVRKMIKNEGKV